MVTRILSVKLDETTCTRLKEAAQRMGRAPHWLLRQAVATYLETLEKGAAPSQAYVQADAPAQSAPAESRWVEFAADLVPQPPLRAAITSAYCRPEAESMPLLVERARLSAAELVAVRQLADRLARPLRDAGSGSARAGLMQGLLQEFALSSEEGVALMCLAEALLRVPDRATRDTLIRDKISTGNWRRHLGHSPSPFVNAATWGLLMTGRLVGTHNETGLSAALNRIIAKSGEPLVRRGVDMAMRLLGEQFVIGENIAAALANASALERKGFRYSYDMLGEAAHTEADALRYLASYEQAIHAIGNAAHGRAMYEGPGISIKLSALHPRYSRAQRGRVVDELYPRLRRLAVLARHYDIGFNIDAEEADRLELSLDLLEWLCHEPELAGWNGIGFVVQAYQKRCCHVIEALIDLARRSQHRLMVRLVKGAYWDSEIKRTQVLGLEDYPVFTRKAHTDVAYIACARMLLSAPDAVFPQFATHNAQTLATVYHLAGPGYYPGQYEFQCLHGMGEALYDLVIGKAADGGLNRPCRIYAPVGRHDTLLAYLVRRLLENGANTSFVHRIADPEVALDELIADPVASVVSRVASEGRLGLPHPLIPLPRAIYGSARENSRGIDLSNEQRLASLASILLTSAERDWRAAPMLDGPPVEMAGEAAEGSDGDWAPVRNPADWRDVVGHVRGAGTADIERACRNAVDAAPIWQVTPPAERAALLERAAAQMEYEMPLLSGLLVRESGKTLANAIAEVREAVDFLRYYAAQVRREFNNASHRPLGPVACISPWNFPLAIFVGQVGAALAAGNTVLAKPAEQTPLIAAQAVRILLEAGIPAGALQLLPGPGETVGAQLGADPRVGGILFTGSLAVARALQQSIAGRLDTEGRGAPLVAETGGLNTMIVDSSALAEQVIEDVMTSAFDSAGQRCSALRVLCLQDDIADSMLAMLKGAMAEYRMGDPQRLAVDIGPVIDSASRDAVERHIQAMRDSGRTVTRLARVEGADCDHGTFVMPALIELDDISELNEEVFGPVLHVVRYRRRELGALLERINASGFGLTLGLQTRIDEVIAAVAEQARVGNLYVNRNMVGAAVGVQPFGGEGLSGTGPKAGGPLYLYRLLSVRPADAPHHSLSRQLELHQAERQRAMLRPLSILQKWARRQGWAELAATCDRFDAQSLSGTTCLLDGPTGERNSYSLLGRRCILCLAESDSDRLTQLAAVLAVGGSACWVTGEATSALRARLPQDIQTHIALIEGIDSEAIGFDAALHHGDPDQLRRVRQQLARRPGAIVTVHGWSPGDTLIPLDCLLVERVLSINTAASGGNASLMNLG